MIVAGFGFRRDVELAALQTALDAALAACSLRRASLDALATAADKVCEPSLQELARLAELPLIAVDAADMQRASPNAHTHSARVLALRNVPSVSETCALAAAGREPRLLCARVANHEATCAIAEGGSL